MRQNVTHFLLDLPAQVAANSYILSKTRLISNLIAWQDLFTGKHV